MRVVEVAREGGTVEEKRRGQEGGRERETVEEGEREGGRVEEKMKGQEERRKGVRKSESE